MDCVSYQERQRVAALALALLAKGGAPELASKLTIEWNPDFTRRLGDASYLRTRVRFSIPLWGRSSEAQHDETVAHEIAHLIAHHLYGRTRRVSPHGAEWLRVMASLGYPNAARCHKVDRTGLRRQQARVAVARCDCTTHQLTARRVRSIASGVKYVCRKCHSELRLAA